MSSISRKLRKDLGKKAMQVAMKLMQDDRTRPLVAKAMQGFMEGRQKFDEARDEAVRGLGLMTRGELDRLQGRVRRLGRRLDDATSRIAALAG